MTPAKYTETPYVLPTSRQSPLFGLLDFMRLDIDSRAVVFESRNNELLAASLVRAVISREEAVVSEQRNDKLLAASLAESECGG